MEMSDAEARWLEVQRNVVGLMRSKRYTDAIAYLTSAYNLDELRGQARADVLGFLAILHHHTGDRAVENAVLLRALTSKFESAYSKYVMEMSLASNYEKDGCAHEARYWRVRSLLTALEDPTIAEGHTVKSLLTDTASPPGAEEMDIIKRILRQSCALFRMPFDESMDYVALADAIEEAKGKPLPGPKV